MTEKTEKITRHPSLQPFSRDHVVALFHAQRFINSQDKTLHEKGDLVRAFLVDWNNEISKHFEDEERLLLPLTNSRQDKIKLQQDHTDLRQLVTFLVKDTISANHMQELLIKLGHSLDQHIRWEEHHYFPSIESSLEPQELETLGKDTEEIEATRKRTITR